MPSAHTYERIDLCTSQSYHAMINAMADPLYVCNDHYEVVYANKALKDLAGADPTGSHCYRSVFNRETPCPWCRMHETNTGQPTTYEIDNTHYHKHFHVSSSSLTHQDGSLLHMHIMRDITKEKQLEQQLNHTHKLEAIGQLAGGVAHDFNNVLGAIVGYAEMIRDNNINGNGTPIDAKLHRRIGLILDASLRSSQLVRKLLNFSRKGTYRFSRVDCHTIIQECITMLSHTIDKRIHIHTGFKAPQTVIHADSEQLENALLNLALNARDAMPEGGDLYFSTGNLHVRQEETPYLASHLKEGMYCTCTVTDTGTGIPAHIIDRIFDPFFTTKSRDHGTGLGLPGVYGCIKAHKGHIDVHSTPGEGSTFTIYLPVSEHTQSSPSHETHTSHSTGGSGTVMIIDDEEWIREIAAQMCENLGYAPHAFGRCTEALEFYRSHGDTVTLVIIDMMMPDHSGNECLEMLQRIDPDVRALITTGYSVSQKTKQAMDAGARGLLPKPFTQHQLQDKIAEALA